MRNRQAGDSKIGCILWVLGLAICAMVAVKMVPVKVKTAELEDFMVEQAQWAYNAETSAIKKNILARARELELPLEEDDLRVERVRDRIQMEASYTVPIEFPGYTYEWRIHHLVDRQVFLV